MLPLRCTLSTKHSHPGCNVYAQNMAIDAKLVQDLDGARFLTDLCGYGRRIPPQFRKIGLASRHYLKHFPLRLTNMMPMGMGMLSRKRMNLTPTRIKKPETAQGHFEACQGTGGRTMSDYILYPGWFDGDRSAGFTMIHSKPSANRSVST